MKVAGRWTWFKLYTDKRASQHAWGEFIRKQEQRISGVLTPPIEYADSPVQEHVEAYLKQLARTVQPAHLCIADFMLRRLVTLAGWQRLRDLTADSLNHVRDVLIADGKTVSYANKFITRGKAFAHWLMLEPAKLALDPFVGVKRGNVRRAVKRRARRALRDDEARALLDRAPKKRRLKYLLLLLTGLRRSELAGLAWADLCLEEQVPFIRLREELTKNCHADALPLHPRLVQELKRIPKGSGQTRVVDSVPDVKTLVKDLAAAGVPQLDALGRRIDIHAFRHTFATNLDRLGCSRAMKKALTRHGDDDVTDGYSHTHLLELHKVVARLPDPLGAAPVDVQAGADDARAAVVRRSYAGHFSDVDWQALARRSAAERGAKSLGRTERIDDRDEHGRALAGTDLPGSGNADIVRKPRPDTQAV